MGSSDYVTRISESLADIDPSAWDELLRLQAAPTPFMQHAYLSALQDSGSACESTGWKLHVFTLEHAGTLEAACAVYEKSHSYGEYVFDWAWASAYQQHGLHYYPKAVVAVPFTPVPGSRLLARDDAARQALLKELVRWSGVNKLSSLHILFSDAADVRIAADVGLMQRSTLQFHWTNSQPRFASFDEFLATLTQEKRKKIRQERSKVRDAGVQFRWSRGGDISALDWDFFYRCYERTYLEHGNAPYLTRDFFQRMARSMPENWLLFIAERAGDPVASSLIAIDAHSTGPAGSLDINAPDKVAYGRYWGSLERVDCLHFEACYYQPLEWCIKHQFDRFEGGAQGEHKMARALLPVTTFSSHWLAHPQFAAAVQQYLAREGEHVERYMDELQKRSPLRTVN
jgi:predicted N-acyltransferase